MNQKQWMMPTLASVGALTLGGCAGEQVRTRTFVLAPKATLTSMPEGTEFPELEAEIGRAGPDLARTLGYRGYDVSAVVPQTSSWRYVRDSRLRVVVRRNAQLGIALKLRSTRQRCLYLEPTVVQDRLGAGDWGPLRLGSTPYTARRLDCDLLVTPLALR